MEGKRDKFVGREERIELVFGETMGMMLVARQLEQVNNVDESRLAIREVLMQEAVDSKGFLTDDISASSDEGVEFLLDVGTTPVPHADSLGAMSNG